MANKYDVANLVRGRGGKYRCNLRENGIIIARASRGATLNGWVGGFKIKFLSDASKARFDDYCDSCFISEVVDLLVAGHKE